MLKKMYSFLALIKINTATLSTLVFLSTIIYILAFSTLIFAKYFKKNL